MTKHDAGAIADEILAAIDAHVARSQPFTDARSVILRSSARCAALAEAARRNAKARGERPVGRKIGFTNRTSGRNTASSPRSGATCTTPPSRIAARRNAFDLRGFEPRIEPEIAFRLRARARARHGRARRSSAASTGSRTASRSCSRSSPAGASPPPTPSRRSACTGPYSSLGPAPADSRQASVAALARSTGDLRDRRWPRDGALVDRGKAAATSSTGRSRRCAIWSSCSRRTASTRRSRLARSSPPARSRAPSPWRRAKHGRPRSRASRLDGDRRSNSPRAKRRAALSDGPSIVKPQPGSRTGCIRPSSGSSVLERAEGPVHKPPRIRR